MSGELHTEIVRILTDEKGRAPMSADSLRAVLRAAVGIYLKDGEIETALDQLLDAGKIEAVSSAKLGRRWRAPQNAPEPSSAT